MLKRILVLASLLLLPAAVRADNIAQDAGPFELTLGGSGYNDKSFRGGSAALSGSLGFFVLPNIELSVRDNASYTDVGAGHNFANDVRGAVDFNLNFNRLQPFVGANIGYKSGGGDTAEAAPEAGLKVFLNKSTFIYGQVEYEFLFRSSSLGSVSSASSAVSNGQFVYGVGLGVRF